MYCKECNYQISYGAKFCPICGAKTAYYKNEEVYKEQNMVPTYNNQNLEKKSHEYKQYLEQIESPTYFSRKEIVIGYASDALIFAMVCISIKFAIDMFTVISEYSDGIRTEFHINYFTFAFDYIKNMCILYALKIIVNEVYYTIKKLLKNQKYELFMKMEDTNDKK